MPYFRSSGISNIPPVVKNLILINVIMLLATWVFSTAYGIQLNSILGLYYFKSELFEPYQIVTHMFMHGGFMHLFFNMFALYMFGRVLETVWGSRRFFVYFIVTVINNPHYSACSPAIFPGEQQYSVGILVRLVFLLVV